MGEFRFNDYNYLDIPAEVWKAWSDSSSAWNADPSSSPLWILGKSWRTDELAGMHLITGQDSSGNYLGFWPFEISTESLKGFLLVSSCYPWGGKSGIDLGFSPRCRFWAIVSPDATAEFLEGFVRVFLDRLRCKKTTTGNIWKDTAFYDAWSRGIKTRRLPYIRIDREEAVFRNLDSFDAFVASALGKKHRRNFRKIQKQYVDSGIVGIEHIANFQGDEMERTLKRLSGIYAESWKARTANTPVNLTIPEVMIAFAEKVKAFADKGALHVALITVRGDDAAFWVGVRNGEEYLSLQTAYKERYSDYSVGFIAMMESVRYSAASGISANNLMECLEDYKKNVGAEFRESCSYFLYDRSPLGLSLWTVKKIKTALNHTFLSSERKYIFQRSDLEMKDS